jgi:hypothetical protein
MTLKGAMHVHSTYSDGEFTLAELRTVLLSEGCAFVCMTDHAEYFDEQSIRHYLAECESLSDAKFFFVPGLEYRCDREMHILGYAATQLTKTKDPEEVIRHIDSQGAISVIAHPKNDFFPWIERFETLPQGIETWNTKYDGRYAPRSGTFALLQRLKQRSPGMHAFYGLDLHWKKQFREFFINVNVTSGCGKPTLIVGALAAGDYVAQKNDLQLPSSGILPPALLAEFERVHARSYGMWRLLKKSKQMLDRLGIPIPELLKAQLRRIF